jgi:thymidylate kinase
MTATRRAAGSLIAVDGVNGAAVNAAAKKAIKSMPRSERGGVSLWDASGLFGELVAADDGAGRPSARTLLLLYAADLAFRLRWEIRPAIAEGRTVAAAPYVATAIAFGRAAGLPGGWLKNLFAFAARPDAVQLVDKASPRKAKPLCFVDFACDHLASNGRGLSRRQLAARARSHLKVSARF